MQFTSESSSPLSAPLWTGAPRKAVHRLHGRCELNQRWKNRLTSYRPSGELIKTSEYDVVPIAGDREARQFVQMHHYSGSYPAARFRFGLYRCGALAGVAVFSVPCSDSVLTNVFPMPASMSVELGRFVLLDSVPGNGETWFLARVFRELRKEGLVGVVSFSDPLPRRTIEGTLIHRGHVGTIYQAFNGAYLGRSAPPDATHSSRWVSLQ